MTNPKEYIKEQLAEMERSNEINPHIHALLLSRLDSMVATISDHDSVADAVKCELCGLGIEPGYQHYGEIMVALTRKEALAVFDEGRGAVFAVCSDGTEFELDSREQIANGDYCFAMEKGHTLTFRPEMEMRL